MRGEVLDDILSRWKRLLLAFRQAWWTARLPRIFKNRNRHRIRQVSRTRSYTDYGRHPPLPEFVKIAPELLAVEQAECEALPRRIAADTAQTREFLQRADYRRLCVECLRPPSCHERCLRSMLHPQDPRVDGVFELDSW